VSRFLASVKRRAILLAKGIATASLLGWFFFQFDLPETLALLRRVHPGYVFVPFTLAVVVIGMGAMRWRLLLGVLQLRRPFKEICAVTFISNFFNSFLPSKLGGEAVRAYYGVKITGRPGEVVLSILIDRYIGLVGLMSLPLAVILVRRPTGGLQETVGFVYAAVSALLLVAVFMSLLIRSGSLTPSSKTPQTRVVALLQDVKSSLQLYGQHKGVLLQALGISVAIHILAIAIYYALGASFGEGKHLLDFMYFIPMVTLAAMMPVSLGGLGVREWTFVYLFTELGIPLQTALLISLLNLLVKTGAGLIGAVLYLGWQYRPTQRAVLR